MPVSPRVSRRSFLGSVVPAAAGIVGAGPVIFEPARALAAVRDLHADDRPPDQIARDEDFWAHVQRAFMMDRTIVNLNNGGCSPSPTIVHDALKRRLDEANRLPPPHVLWQVQHPQVEVVRARLARRWGVDPEEIALTRNSSESLQICQMGLDLARGDEVLTSTLDYPRMLTAFRQRERRDGIVLKTVSLPIPCEDDDEILRRFERAITPRTRLMLVSHIVNITGQILPVKRLVEMARGKNSGIPVIVDGAHALAHFEFSLADLGCDYYGVSLHKWLHAPIGTGLLYVRRSKIKGLWPLMAAPPEMDDDIRKFEEIGTHPEGLALGVGEALTFHETVGGARKEARLRYLRDRWATRLLASGRAHLHTSLDPRFSCGIATVRFDGLDTAALHSHLWDRHRILTTPITHAEFEGLRITPSTYTTLDELDRFAEAIERALARGL